MGVLRLIVTSCLMLAGQSALANEVMSALVPQGDGRHLLVTIHDKACDPKSGNVNIYSTQGSLRGCWQRDGDLIRVQLLDSSEIRVFPRREFKLMGGLNPIAKSEQQANQTTNLTCAADAWAGDIVVERNPDGALKSVFVSGEKVEASEQANTINFSYKGLTIGLSTLTGMFNYDTSGLQSYLNNRFLGRGSAKGVGRCILNSAGRQF